VRWEKPLAGHLKLNCDASFKSETGESSWGFLVCDWDGDVVLTKRGKINHLLSAFQAEMEACLQGVQAAISIEAGNLILESDSLIAVRRSTLVHTQSPQLVV
jgi:ribonuclease HI